MTRLRNSWDHLQHCICASRCPCLVMGHFCSVNVYKPHLKSPCGGIMAVLWMCPLGHPGGNTVCLPCSASPERLSPSAAPGPPSFLPAPHLYLASLGFSERGEQQDIWVWLIWLYDSFMVESLPWLWSEQHMWRQTQAHTDVGSRRTQIVVAGLEDGEKGP